MQTLKELRIYRLMYSIEQRINELTVIIKCAASDYYNGDINHRSALKIYRSNIEQLMRYIRIYQSLSYESGMNKDRSKELVSEAHGLISFFES